MYINEKVPIEDVFPLKDEHGNDFARRDYTQKANRDYVARLAESFDKATLQPDEMPVLVQDGGIYYIAAGNSRVEAMRHLGVKFFRAVVLDDTVEEAIEKKLLETAIRTNVKKTYEDGELAEFTRQLMLFGDDQYVSDVTGIERERVGRIRRGAAHAGEAVDQMPIGWYEAVAEFEDDPAALERLTSATSKTWDSVAASLRAARRASEAWEEMERALAMGGALISDEVPDGYAYTSRYRTASDLPGEFPAGAVAVFDGSGWANLYVPGDADPAEEERKRAEDERRQLMADTASAREEWLAGAILGDLGQLAPLMGLPGQCESPYWHGINDMISHLVGNLPKVAADAVNSYMGNRTEPWHTVGDGAYEPVPDKCRRFTALTDAMELCGYEPPEAEQRLYQMCVDAIGKEGKDE